MNPSVENIMVKEVLSVRLDMPLPDVAKILGEHKFDGMPVVDDTNTLVGVITEYDLISKGSAVHIPTLQKIFENLSVIKEDRVRFQKEMQEITGLMVQDVMNTDPLTLPFSASFEEVVAAFRDHHRVNQVPVIDKDRKVMGVVSRYDVLKFFNLER